MSNDDPYLIWSNGHRGWWRANATGYSRGLQGAGRFSYREALNICANAIMTAPHIGIISELPVRLADVETFLAMRRNIPREITGDVAEESGLDIA